ncbi:hypothetical protein cyc_00174 [Cyclospora cayetanensis]|uniref:CBM20 domain-containing protein n=1 Tax=Cyclospora cayetanensis TaxID=88456 RepID=A0A1D3CXN2_9EIME|nr:hypothetical protein cyc_00174 [Cyclospora cayetanensis]
MASACRSCYVTFHCICENTSIGEELCVLGSASSLGEWQLPLRIRLSTSKGTFPLWVSPPVPLPAGLAIKYKYVIVPLCKCNPPSNVLSKAQPPEQAPCRCCSSASNSPCRWECIAGHDDSGNRIARLCRGSHDLFDKFGQCDFPPLTMSSTPQPLAAPCASPASFLKTRSPSSHSSNTAYTSPSSEHDSWMRTDSSVCSSSPHASSASQDRPLKLHLPVPSESSQEAAVLLKILKAIEKLCKNNALQARWAGGLCALVIGGASCQVGDLRHTLEDSHGELLRQLLVSVAFSRIASGRPENKLPSSCYGFSHPCMYAPLTTQMGTGDTERCEALTTRVASAAAASTAATTSEAVTTAHMESLLAKKISQIAEETVAASMTKATQKLQETMEKLLTNAKHTRYESGSFSSFESVLRSSPGTWISAADKSLMLTEGAEPELAVYLGSNRRSRSADELRRVKGKQHRQSGHGGSLKEETIRENTLSEVPLHQQVPSQPSPASFGMSEAVLMSKDIGPDLSWIQSMLHDIKRENAGNRQLLGWICHNLDAALCSRKYQEQLQLHLHQRRGQREEERGEGGDTARTFHIFTPVDLSRQSSTASLYHEEETERVITATMEDNGREDKSRPHAHVAPPCIASPSSPVEPCAQIYRKVSSVETEQKETEDEEEDEASCVASPRAVVEKASINMTESFEKFNCKNHHFPNVYTSTGNLEWEHYVSTSKGLHKGTG